MSSDKTTILDPERSMKPLLGKLIEQAVHLAFIDSCLAIAMDGIIEAEGVDAWLAKSDQVKTEWAHDIHNIPSEVIAQMSPLALAQNVAVRLLGPGGWSVGGVYAGNATARELLEASFERPDHSHVDEIAFDVLKAMEEAHTLYQTCPCNIDSDGTPIWGDDKGDPDCPMCHGAGRATWDQIYGGESQ